VHKEQGSDPNLHYIKNRTADIITWVRDYCGKPLSTTTLWSYIYKWHFKILLCKKRRFMLILFGGSIDFFGLGGIFRRNPTISQENRKYIINEPYEICKTKQKICWVIQSIMKKSLNKYKKHHFSIVFPFLAVLLLLKENHQITENPVSQQKTTVKTDEQFYVIFHRDSQHACSAG